MLVLSSCVDIFMAPALGPVFCGLTTGRAPGAIYYCYCRVICCSCFCVNLSAFPLQVLSKLLLMMRLWLAGTTAADVFGDDFFAICTACCTPVATEVRSADTARLLLLACWYLRRGSSEAVCIILYVISLFSKPSAGCCLLASFC